MKIKTKLYISLFSLLLVIILIAGIAAYYLNRLGNDSKAIIQDNYRTLGYMNNISSEMDKLLNALSDTTIYRQDQVDGIFNRADSIMKLQLANITEPGEIEISSELKTSLELFSSDLRKWNEKQLSQPVPGTLVAPWKRIKEEARHIYTLNEATILKKSEKAKRTADQVYLYMVFLGLGSIVIGLLFVLILPGYIIKPVKSLMEGIKEIGRRNYKHQLQIISHDELGELAASFNTMAAKLDEYEHSNLAEAMKSRKRTEAVINHMHEAVIGLDENLQVLFLNQYALDVLDFQEENITGKHASDLAARNKLFNSLYSEIMVGSYVDSEFKAVKAEINGMETVFSREIISLSAKPTGEDREVHFGFVIVLHDITKLLARDRAKTMFIATLSHEFKTPLASIELSTGLLENEKVGLLNSEQMGLVHIIRQNYERIQRMATEMLEIAKIETGHVKVEIQPVNILHIIEKALSGVELQLKEKELTLDRKLPENIPPILADPHKTVWVLNNFLTNAVRYSPLAGTLTLGIQVFKGSLMISVKDHGPGIKEEEQRHIFEKFYRLEQNDEKGTGLGLAISKEFAIAMNGSIGVNSRPGQGAEFWIRLPLQKKLDTK